MNQELEISDYKRIYLSVCEKMISELEKFAASRKSDKTSGFFAGENPVKDDFKNYSRFCSALYSAIEDIFSLLESISGKEYENGEALTVLSQKLLEGKYFGTGNTADDPEALSSEIARLENENAVLSSLSISCHDVCLQAAEAFISDFEKAYKEHASLAVFYTRAAYIANLYKNEISRINRP